MSKSTLNAELKKQAQRAQSISAVLIDSQFSAGGYIKNPEERDNSIILAAMSDDSIYASMGDDLGKQIALVHASSIREYERQTGELPSDALLASLHVQLENLYGGSVGAEAKPDQLLASLNTEAMSSTKGIDIRANTAAVTLPAMLLNPLNDAITYIPNARKNETEIFNVERVAASTFGGLTKGDVINQMTTARYTQLRHRFDTPDQPDGTRTNFSFDSNTDGMGVKTPFVQGKVRVYIDRKIVATDLQRDGKFLGTVEVNGGDVAITGTVDYGVGTATITAGSALPAGLSVAIGFDVDIEADSNLIPSVDHKMESFKVTPSQRVIAADASIQAMFAASTEFGFNHRSLNLSAMRDTLADEKARNQLADIYWHTTEIANYDASSLNGVNDWRVEAEKLRAKLNDISTQMLSRNEESGLVGMYCGIQWSTLFKSLPSDMFTPAPRYVQKPNIHYVGMLFGRYRIYEVPQSALVPADEFIGYSKSDKVGRCGYLTGDVVPPTLYSHDVTKGLVKGDTLWALGYDEVHPRTGSDFFIKVKMTNYSLGA